ncbi:Insulinase family protein [Acanthopleuribacter pedis]
MTYWKGLTTALCVLSGLVGGLFADDGLKLPHVHYQLDNGLNVILYQDDAVPMVAVNMWYHVGSGHEKVGRTGFAHLFEHILFEGSKNVPEGYFDIWLEEVGGENNGSTTTDRTNYYEIVPKHALELALFLESDRMGFLLEAMSQKKLDGQRDIVKNERRERYDNAPYGQVFPNLVEMLYPKGHPYSWSPIGDMADLDAASLEDVVEFFKVYYGPNNASLVIAGDIEIEPTKALVEKWFGAIPRGKPVPPLASVGARIDGEKRRVLEDDVQLERVVLGWNTPRAFGPTDATFDILAQLLTGGKNSRLHKRLVYDLQIAQSVSAFNWSKLQGSDFIIIATGRAGVSAAQLEKVIDEELEKLKQEAPAARELQRVINQTRAATLAGLQDIETVAETLNRYYFYTGNPDYLGEELGALSLVEPQDVSTMAKTYLRPDRRVVITVVPKKQGADAEGGTP